MGKIPGWGLRETMEGQETHRKRNDEDDPRRRRS